MTTWIYGHPRYDRRKYKITPHIRPQRYKSTPELRPFLGLPKVTQLRHVVSELRPPQNKDHFAHELKSYIPVVSFSLISNMFCYFIVHMMLDVSPFCLRQDAPVHKKRKKSKQQSLAEEKNVTGLGEHSSSPSTHPPHQKFDSRQQPTVLRKKRDPERDRRTVFVGNLPNTLSRKVRKKVTNTSRKGTTMILATMTTGYHDYWIQKY